MPRRRAAPVAAVAVEAAVELRGGQPVAERVIHRRDLREALDRLHGTGAQLLHERQQLGAHPVAQVRRIHVRRVVAVLDAGIVERGAEGDAPLGEQRTHDSAPAPRDAADAARPGAAQEVDEDGFRGVVRRVGGGDQGAALCGELIEESVPCLAAGVLDGATLGARQRGDIGPAKGERQAQAIRRVLDEGGVIRALCAQPVVEMRDGEAPMPGTGVHDLRGAVEERHGVRAA